MAAHANQAVVDVLAPGASRQRTAELDGQQAEDVVHETLSNASDISPVIHSTGSSPGKG